MKLRNIAKVISFALVLTMPLSYCFAAGPTGSDASVEYYGTGETINQSNMDTASKQTEVSVTRAMGGDGADGFAVIIPKKITLSGDPVDISGYGYGTDAKGHLSHYNIGIKGDFPGDYQVKVEPAATVTMTQNNKDSVTGKVWQTYSFYKLNSTAASTTDGTDTVADTSIKKNGTRTILYDTAYLNSTSGGYTDVDNGTVVVPKLSAGTWSGTFTYTISLDQISP